MVTQPGNRFSAAAVYESVELPLTGASCPTQRSTRIEGRTHMSPVVNADTPAPISDVIQAKSLMYSRSLNGQKRD